MKKSEIKEMLSEIQQYQDMIDKEIIRIKELINRTKGNIRLALRYNNTGRLIDTEKTLQNIFNLIDDIASSVDMIDNYNAHTLMIATKPI